jgi:peptide/nickel transport system permease protein
MSTELGAIPAAPQPAERPPVLEQTAGVAPAHPRPRNWPLRIGSALVLLVIIVAFLGPWLAPADPMGRVAVLQIGGKISGPPYPPGAPGFLLGSDRAGRDIFSRLLWGIQPTLALVAIIAIVRLLLGVAIGLAAGYGDGLSRRISDFAIRIALAVPVLVVALATIAFIGIQRGLFAFLLGLCLTGWGESARYVETQVRMVSHQPFMEAAQSLGAPRRHLVLYHIVRHVLPLAAMLLALEVSSTLMTTAALGFLGYYLGGGAWVTTEDWVARSTAGMPELGQMLATAIEQIFNPWPMVIVGGVVVIIVFGFSLLGEGLRRQLEGENGYGIPILDRTLNWLGSVINRTPSRGRRSGSLRALQAATALTAAAAVVVLLIGWFGRDAVRASNPTFSLTSPGGQLWATQRHDPYGTMAIAGAGPLAPVVLWSYQHDAGFAGAPAIAADGSLFLATSDNGVVKVDAQGALQQRWSLPAKPVGSPAIGPDGTVYVVDAGPGLSALAADGTVRWRFTSEGRRPTSGPIVGPDGTIYFTRVDRIQAVNPDGQERWLTQPAESSQEQPPRLSPDGALLFLGSNIYDAQTGNPAPVVLPIRDDLRFMNPQFATGADGAMYLLAGNTAIRWQITDDTAAADRVITWDVGGLNIYLPTNAGIAADGSFWLFFGNGFTNARLAWLDADSKALANMEGPQRNAQLIGIAPGGRAYLCIPGRPPTCMVMDRSTRSATWSLDMPAGDGVAGGAVTADRLYMATEDGWLFALADPAS